MDGSDSECFGSHHRWQARALARLELIFRTRPKAYRVDQKCHRETQTHVHLNDATRMKPGPMSRSTLHLERIRAISRVARQLRCVHPPLLSPLLHLSPFYYSFLSPLLPFRRVFSRFTDLSHVPPIFPAFRLSFQEFRDLSLRVPSLSLKFQRFFLRFPNVCHDFFSVAISCHVFVVTFEVWSANGTRFSRISPNFHTVRPFPTHISIIFKRLASFSA